MQADLRDFLFHLFGTITMALVPVVLIAFITMPMSLHHRSGMPAGQEAAAPQHMT